MEIFSEDALLTPEDDSDDEGDEDLLSVELEELHSTEIQAVSDRPAPPPLKAREEDLLDTLEMPVFRVPGALGRKATTPLGTAAPTVNEGGDEARPIRLSNALRRGRNTRESAPATPTLSDRESLPDVVMDQPAGLLVEWKEGLPAEAVAANAAAMAMARNGVTSQPAVRTAEALPPPPVVESKDGNQEFLSDEVEVFEENDDSQEPPGDRATSVDRPATPPAPQPPTALKTRPPVSGEPDDDMSGLVQELLGEAEPATSKHAPVRRTAWWEEIFTEEYFRTLPLGFHKQTQRESKFITESLGVGEGGAILDLCCGFGRHTLELAKRGYDMAGLDLSLPLLQKALNEAQRRNLSIKFIHGDVRELNFLEIFDGIFNFQTSFGYFDDRTNYNIFKGVFRALKPGGRFLIELVNRDYVVQELPLRVWWEGTDCLFLEEVSFNFDRSVLHTKRSFIYDDGRPPWEQNIHIRLYSRHELNRMLESAGFNLVSVSGHTATRGVFLGASSPQLIVLAERPI